MNSNLPPGVTTSMIPGNRPEDLDEEAFWEAFATECDKQGLGVPEFDEVRDAHGPFDIEALIVVARDIGYAKGAADVSDYYA
jgi:hypothetical protein